MISQSTLTQSRRVSHYLKNSVLIARVNAKNRLRERRDARESGVGANYDLFYLMYPNAAGPKRRRGR